MYTMPNFWATSFFPIAIPTFKMNHTGAYLICPTPFFACKTERMVGHHSVKMGVKEGSVSLHSITNLTLANLAHMCRWLAEKNDSTAPRVVADCSNLVYIFKDSYTPVAVLLANFFCKLTVAGVAVAPVCDGKVRPTAKQATNIQNANQEKSCIVALQFCSRIRVIKDALSEINSMDESLTAILEKQLT
jgi:hypothetical protein